MKELQRKHKLRKFLYSIPSLCLLLIMAFLMARGTFNVLGKEKESAKRLRELENRASLLALREQELEGGIRQLKTREGVESEIRGRFSVTQEGENVAIIVDRPDTRSSSDESSKESWYKKFWNAIIGK